MKRLLIAAIGILIAIASSAQLPDITLTDVNGQKVNIASLSQQGHPVILSFFATWCKPCMRELSALHDLYPDWQAETGVEIIIVSVDEGQDLLKVKPLVDGNNWEYRALLDKDGQLKQALNVQSIPHVFVINKEGNIVYNHVGYVDGDEDALIKCLR